jgi:hypothetical protein
MTRRDRVIYALAGLALIFLYPGLQWIRFWPQSEARVAAFHEMERQADAVFRVYKRPLRCDERFDRHEWSFKHPTPTINREEIRHYGVDTRAYIRAGLSDNGREDGVWDWNNPQTTHPIRELTRLVRELRDYQQDWTGPLQWMCTGGDVKAAEAKARRALDEHVDTLRRHMKKMQVHAAEHEKIRPLVAILAWAAMALEVSGGLCLLIVVRRAWRRRRKPKSPPPVDPHWRTTEAGEQAPRSSPWPLALFFALAAAGTVAAMLLARGCG